MMATFASTGNSETSILASNPAFLLGSKGFSVMRIHLDNQFRSKIYTTGSKVSGVLVIKTARDVRFDSLEIMFIGASRTRIDGMAAPHSTQHTFLKQEMPIPITSYPVPRIYEAGLTYSVPFNFVIPSHLTINACNHDIRDDVIREHHLSLPPTMGSWEKDDFSPEMARVEYYIKARVMQDAETGGKRAKLIEASQQVRLLPAHPEAAPLNVTKDDKLYTMSKSKTLRKSILSPKSGKVTVTAHQPRAVMVNPDGHSISDTNVQLDLEFEPATSQALLPKVTNVSSKITALSYFSSGGINIFPNHSDRNRSFGSDGRGLYSSSTSLSSTILTLGDMAWQQHLTAHRCDSGYDSDMTSAESVMSSRSSSDGRRRRGRKYSSKGRDAPYYNTTSLQVTVKLPENKKMYIPTFHSCITSRVYILSLTVTVSLGGSSSNITLGLPLQVGVASVASTTDNTGLPTFEAAVHETEADEYLTPRRLRVPDVQFERCALPGYGT